MVLERSSERNIGMEDGERRGEERRGEERREERESDG